jgi:hypothetical protein
MNPVNFLLNKVGSFYKCGDRYLLAKIILPCDTLSY